MQSQPLKTSGPESTECAGLQLRSATLAHALGECTQEQSIKPPEVGLDRRLSTEPVGLGMRGRGPCEPPKTGSLFTLWTDPDSLHGRLLTKWTDWTECPSGLLGYCLSPDLDRLLEPSSMSDPSGVEGSDLPTSSSGRTGNRFRWGGMP